MTTEQKHTKGPWSASPCENGKEWGVDSGEWGIATCADCPGDGTPKANARRIVACVNACEGIPTDHLENFGLPPFAEKISALREENDTLAARVKELEADVEHYKNAANGHFKQAMRNGERAQIAESKLSTVTAQLDEFLGRVDHSAACGIISQCVCGLDELIAKIEAEKIAKS